MTALPAPGPAVPPPARPIRFLHLTTFYPPASFGGDAMHVARLAHALADAGHEVDVVHCLDAYHLLHPAPPELPFAGHPRVRVHPLRSGYGWLSPLLTHQTGRAGLKRGPIRALLEATPYDVLHYHNVSLLGPGVLGLRGRGRPITLYTTHEHWLVCPTHVLWKFGRRACERPQCLRCTIRAGQPPQLWRYTGGLARAVRHVDRFVAPSRFTAAMHAARAFPAPVGHLPYFLDVEAGGGEPGPRPHDRPYFLFVGRLEAIKGLQTLIPLWREAPADLLVAGTGTMGPALRTRAAAEPRIRFLGAVPQERLGPLYAHAIACLVPSLTYETFGIVILEAFAQRTPVIVRDLGALPEVVEDSGGGLVYRTDRELIEALGRLDRDPGLRAELGARGHAALRRLWSREAHLARYLDLLRTVALDKLGTVPWEGTPAPGRGP